MNTKVSVVVPAYNVGQHLDGCLKSIFKQKFKDFEVIVINDCSTDNTDEIITKYKNKYDNLKYIKNEVNLGVSASRNKGILECRGDYILFIDSDDILEPNMISDLYNTANGMDMAMSGYFIDFADGNIKKVNLNLKEDKIYSGNEILKELLTQKNGVTGHSWNKMIRRKILIDNNIRYPEDMKIYEDITFFTSLYPYCKQINYINNNLYHYIERKNSAIRKVDDRVVYDTKECIDRVKDIILSKNLMIDLESEFASFYSRMVSIAIHKLYTYSNEEKEKLEYLSKFMKNEVFEVEKYNNILKSDYIYDKFHKMMLESYKYSHGDTKKFDYKYKKLYNNNEKLLKLYKKIRPIIKMIKSKN